MVTAMSGIVRLASLRTVITSRVCWESRWKDGKLAIGTLTRKRPLGALASWGDPPPQAASPSVAANAATSVERVPAPLLISGLPASSRRGRGGSTYQLINAADAGSLPCRRINFGRRDSWHLA